MPYKSHRTYSTNHMGSISHHITPLVINILGADTQTRTHTNTHVYRHSQTEAILRNQARAGCSRRAPGLKSFKAIGLMICQVGMTKFVN